MEQEFLPYSSGVADGYEFRIVDYIDLNVKSAAIANNTVSVTFPAVDPDYYWEIERIVVQVINPTGAANVLSSTATIYAGDPTFPANLREATVAGNQAIGDESAALRLQPAQILTIVWNNADNGSNGFAWIQGKKLKRVRVR